MPVLVTALHKDADSLSSARSPAPGVRPLVGGGALLINKPPKPPVW